MRRRKLIAAVGLAVLVAVGAFVVWPRPNRVTRENVSRVEKGMTQAQAEAILGPPGDYTTWEIEETPMLFFQYRPAHLVDLEWMTDDAIATVWIDLVTGRVERSCFTNATPTPTKRGVFDNLLWRAKRLWRRWPLE
jgi:hypothetical protein